MHVKMVERILENLNEVLNMDLGLARYHFRNTDTYVGGYFEDKMHGFWVYHFANDHRYEGAWHEGRRQGFGMHTFKNVETQSGHWVKGFSLFQPLKIHRFLKRLLSHVKVLKQSRSKIYSWKRSICSRCGSC